MKIILGAIISRHPFVPGSVWNRMHWAMGLRMLGHEVFLVEQLRPEWCVDEHGQRCDYHRSMNRAHFIRTMQRFGLTENACQLYNDGESTNGLSVQLLEQVARDADLLINHSGHVTSGLVLDHVKRRAYVDQDPAYTQLWHAEYGKDLNFAAHDVFFSVGLNIGTPRSPIPDCGIRWHPILPPVVLEYWPFDVDASCASFTTVASWGGYGELEYRGEWLKPKYDQFVRFADLPRRVNQEFEIALKRCDDSDPGIRQLRDNGWSLTESSRFGTLESYQSYLRHSRGEIGIAKTAYVKSSSGWFSDRSAQYLACGKPVLAQSTGFESILPTGRGLLCFQDLDQAADGIESINRDYPAHCRAAREFATQYLDFRKVLPAMLDVCTSDSALRRHASDGMQEVAL